MIEIKDKAMCCGCGACKNACPKDCITMTADAEGFLYPQVDRAGCTQCGLCEKACQYLQGKQVKHTLEKPQVYAAQSKEKQPLYDSTSGGFCQMLTEYVIEKGGVVFGAGYDKTMTVRHSCGQTAAQCMPFQKSKYVQSVIGDCYKDAKRFLQKGTTVLFTGTPCQIGGLYQFLGREYDNLITVDLVCYGVPSPRIFADYVNFTENKKHSALKQIDFRDKSRGWGKNCIRYFFADASKDYRIPSYQDPYSALFISHMATRQSCHNCLYANLQRYSDFTAGDFWGDHTFAPPLVKKDGISKILINSDKGKAVWNKISGAFLARQMPLETAIQPNLVSPPKKSPKRDVFYRDYVQRGYSYAIKKHVQEPFYKRAYYELRWQAIKLLRR